MSENSVTSVLDEFAKNRNDFYLNLGIKVGAGKLYHITYMI